MVGSPLPGIDDQEMVDTHELCNALDDLVRLHPLTGTCGNPIWGNLPQKFNIAISSFQDEFAHIDINDVRLQRCQHAKTGEMGLVLSPYADACILSAWPIQSTRTYESCNLVVILCKAILLIFRDASHCKDQTKAGLMWLVEKYGVD